MNEATNTMNKFVTITMLTVQRAIIYTNIIIFFI